MAILSGLMVYVRGVLGWALRVLRDMTSSSADFIFLRPAFSRRQRILSKRSKTVIEYTVRDKEDFAVLWQMFQAQYYDISRLARGRELLERYRSMVASNRTPLIIDCGANIGASANYFAEIFPKAKIIAIEPEEGNFKQLTAHCQSDRIACINAAVSSTAKKGKVVDAGQGNWGFRVEEAAGGAVSFVTIDALLRDKLGQAATPFIIKIDIEGFERDLFAANTDWVDRFPLLIIELHDWMLPGEASSNTFLKVISSLNRDFIYLGENIFSIANMLF